MTKEINSFNFLKSKSILFLVKDKELINNVESIMVSKINNIVCSNNLPSIKELVTYDLIIVDVDYFVIEQINITFIENEISIPIIYLVSRLNENNFDLIQNPYVKNILIKELQINEIFIYTYLILKESMKINLGYQYEYCLENNSLSYKQKNIKLTKLESKLLKLLIINKNKIIPYNEIVNFVWGEKGCSIYSMRNFIKKIREKSFHGIIRNISNKGYILSTY